FTNSAGPLDSLRTYLPWLQRAEGGSPHINPWTFYFHRLLWFHVGKGMVWSEASLAVLAAVGGWAAFARKGFTDADAGFVRFLTLYVLALMAAYTLIAYKTPWCLLGFWHGTILLAGVGAVALGRYAGRRWLKAVIFLTLLSGAGHLGWQAWQASVPY